MMATTYDNNIGSGEQYRVQMMQLASSGPLVYFLNMLLYDYMLTSVFMLFLASYDDNQ